MIPFKKSTEHRINTGHPIAGFPQTVSFAGLGIFFQTAKPWPYVQGKSQGRFEEAAYFSGLSMTKLPPPRNRRRKKSMCSFGFGTRYPRRMPSNRNSPLRGPAHIHTEFGAGLSRRATAFHPRGLVRHSSETQRIARG